MIQKDLVLIVQMDNFLFYLQSLIIITEKNIMLTPFLILMLAIGDFFLMITSSMYGISAALRLGKTGEISKTASVIYFILHFFFTPLPHESAFS